MAQDFSDAPLRVNGVTIKPTWAWSPQYRAEVANELRNATKGGFSPEEAEDRYIDWYARTHALDLIEARLRIKGLG